MNLPRHQATLMNTLGAWPTPARACSGYLIEDDGFLLLVDPGYATLARLLERVSAHAVDAVFVTHGHPDHCADLNPLLRARNLSNDRPPPLPVYALPGAVGPVLTLDERMLDDEYALREFTAGEDLTVGPFHLATRSLPHFVPNVGVRVTAGDVSIAYTGDGGAGPGVVDLAAGAQVLLAEATFVDEVPDGSRGALSNARQAGEHAAAADVGRLVLTHLWPGADLAAAERAGRETFNGQVTVAVPGLVVDLE